MNWFLFPVVAAVLFWLRWRQKNKRMLEMAEAFPGPPTLPFLGNALELVVRPEELMSVVKSLINTYGTALRLWVGPDLNFIISDPDDIKILLTNSKTSSKGPQYKYMADLIGGGILSGSGPKWRKHRKLAIPNYGKRAIESYNDVFNEEIDLFLRTLKNKEGHNYNIYTDIVNTTTYAVCRTLMGLSREQTLNLPDLQPLIDDSPSIYHVIFDRMTKWYLQIDPIFWLSSGYRQQKHVMKSMKSVCTAIINHRVSALKGLKETFTSELMGSEVDSVKNTELSVVDRFILSGDMDHEELVQETFTIFTSSQEASAKITSALILMLAFHPECQEKLSQEIKTVTGDTDRWISDEDLKQMPYLDMVFNETIRLFPIGSMMQRTIIDDITISSGTLPAGSSLLVPVVHLQRDSRFWKNPEAFDPEHFSPENTRSRPPNCFLPFSLGPMDCLGRYYGKKLIKMISVRMLKEFKVTSLESYKDLKLSLAISAFPRDGYNVILNRRK